MIINRSLLSYLITLSLLLTVMLPSQINNKENIKGKEKNRINIAVIGSGIGGISSSYHLLKNNFLSYIKEKDQSYIIETIDIYEKESKIGGRMKTYSTKDNENDVNIDLGASFILKENLYIMELIELTETKLKSPSKEDKNIAIKDKNLNTVLYLDGGFYINLIKLLWNYNLGIFDANNIVDKFYELFLTLYDNLNKGEYYPTVKEFLEKTSFDSMVTKSTEEYFKTQFNKEFLRDFLNPMLLSCYNQDLNINALAGKIILTAAVRVGYSVEGGFNNFIEKLYSILNKSEVSEIFSTQINEIAEKDLKMLLKDYYKPKIQVHLNNEISTIQKITDKKERNKDNKIYYKLDKETKKYDHVIFATNINLSNIKFINFSDNEDNKENDIEVYKHANENLNNFEVQHEVLVKGELNRELLKLEKINYTAVLFNERLGDEYNNISDIIYQGSGYYKLQVSNKVVDEKKILKLFEANSRIVHVNKWNRAYPILKPITELNSVSEFMLFGNNEAIYYNNAIENYVSCVEVIIISAKNIANIIHGKENMVSKEENINASNYISQDGLISQKEDKLVENANSYVKKKAVIEINKGSSYSSQASMEINDL